MVIFVWGVAKIIGLFYLVNIVFIKLIVKAYVG